jgi:Rrf2 family transcriptional regulator, cysteine metabolism repressor
MNLSTRTKYGVKALSQLLIDSDRGPVPLNVIAEEQGLSESYLEQLMGTLRRAGLVRSMRGAHGGYSLGKAAGEITVGEIVRALDGPIAPCDCVLENTSLQHCGKAAGCVAKGVSERLRDSVSELLDSITLAELVKGHGTQDMNQSPSLEE